MAVLTVGVLLLVPASVRPRVIRRSRSSWRRFGSWRRTSSEAAVMEVLGAFRDELRSGAALRDGFERAAGDCADEIVRHAVATSRLGGDVASALRTGAGGQSLLLALAALWQVCEGSGAAMAAALDRLVQGAEQAAAVRREVRAQLAGPRATVRVLVLLPLIGVGMGLLMGADPVGFLLGTIWGWGCLGLAGLLEVLGVVWMRKLVAGVEASL
ncbi:MAG: type II secretion system F family protein [Micrococcales bacterium]|nr:type II secretion system F family protein [Micrococcales bacterium]